jgi:hypothetical protein
MSIDYSCGVVFGWHVSQEEKDQMLERSNYEYEDEFICLDCYRDNSDYIYGVWLSHGPCDGFCTEINIYKLSRNMSDDFMEESYAKLRHMGCDEWVDDEQHPRHLPRMYVVGQVC